ncbi:RNA methyltransferase [Striga asiatica]|uniref:RNA methyltransferase n=1 Tax=Striga asiatica TaxID=4170 RepID=A0A5A7R7D9_STRAF|nr:RNA methyltransferase [Striga asiatica]
MMEKGDPYIPDCKFGADKFGIALPVPSNAINSFRLLCESSATQVQVFLTIFLDSDMNDPNVWNAIVSIRAMQDILQPKRTYENLSGDIYDVASESGEAKPVIALMDIVQKLKFMASPSCAEIGPETTPCPPRVSTQNASDASVQTD